MLNEHARLRSLLKDAITAMPASGERYCVGMGIDAVVVRGEFAEVVMAGIEAGDAGLDGDVFVGARAFGSSHCSLWIRAPRQLAFVRR